MKNQYTVILRVADRDNLVDIIDAIQGKAMSIEVSIAGLETAFEPKPKLAAPRAPRMRKERRNKRGSRVNNALLGAMSNGPASIQALKAALSEAGMAPSSLSTGLAILTKSGQIERVGEGLYALKVAKAAE